MTVAIMAIRASHWLKGLVEEGMTEETSGSVRDKFSKERLLETYHNDKEILL
jgi:hypothetical protein